MAVVDSELWALTSGRPQVDPAALAAAIEREVAQGQLDFRTRLLIRDSLDALRRHWGDARQAQWLDQSPSRTQLREIACSNLGPPGFPTLHRRIMDTLKPDTIHQFLRELVRLVSRPTRLNIGGAVALVLGGNLSRHTEDIDVADEVPAELRSQHDQIDQLAARYGLRLTHFQSHFLPTGWENRVRSLGRFGNLDVFLADPLDVFVGKLFSARTKDLDDLRHLAPQFDKESLRRRLTTTAGGLLADSSRAKQTQDNWYILYGEGLDEKKDG